MVEGAILVGLIEVRGMTCDNCVKKLTEALEKVPGVMAESEGTEGGAAGGGGGAGGGGRGGAVKVDLKRGEVLVRYDPAKVSMVKLVQVVNSTGYRAVGFKRGNSPK